MKKSKDSNVQLPCSYGSRGVKKLKTEQACVYGLRLWFVLQILIKIVSRKQNFPMQVAFSIAEEATVVEVTSHVPNKSVMWGQEFFFILYSFLIYKF